MKILGKISTKLRKKPETTPPQPTTHMESCQMEPSCQDGASCQMPRRAAKWNRPAARCPGPLPSSRSHRWTKWSQNSLEATEEELPSSKELLMDTTPPPRSKMPTPPRLQKRNADPFPLMNIDPSANGPCPTKIFFGDRYHHRQFSHPWWTLMTWVTPCKESDVKSEIRGMQCNTGLKSRLIDRLKISIIMENIFRLDYNLKTWKCWNYELMIELWNVISQ